MNTSSAAQRASTSASSEAQREKWRKAKARQRAANGVLPIDRFPARFLDILRYFEQNQKGSQTLTVELPEEKMAQQMRWKWYEFKKSVKKNLMLAQQYETACEKIILRVEGIRLTFSWRDLEPAEFAFDQMVIPDTEQDFASLSRLIEKPAGSFTLDYYGIREPSGQQPSRREPSEQPSEREPSRREPSVENLTVEELMKREMMSPPPPGEASGG